MKMSMTGLSSFDVQMKKFAKVIGQNVAVVRDRAGLEIYKRTVEKTPRLTGRLAASWNWSYHGINVETKAAVKTKDFYEKPKALAMHNPNPYAALFIVNGLPYAARIEFTGWSKTKAPQGMLMLAIEETKAGMISVL